MKKIFTFTADAENMQSHASRQRSVFRQEPAIYMMTGEPGRHDGPRPYSAGDGASRE